jgi:hypothetical protein
MSSIYLFDNVHFPGKDESLVTGLQKTGYFTETDRKWLKSRISDLHKFKRFEESVMLFKGPVDDPTEDYCKVERVIYTDPNGADPDKEFVLEGVAICACPDGLDYDNNMRSEWDTEYGVNSHYNRRYSNNESSFVNRRVFIEELTRVGIVSPASESTISSDGTEEEALKWAEHLENVLPDRLPSFFLKDAINYLKENGLDGVSLKEIIEAKWQE